MRTPIAILLFACGILASSLSAQNTPQRPSLSEKRFAIIIGAEPYDDPDLKLTGPRKDAVEMRNLLVRYAGFLDDPDHIVLMTTGQGAAKLPTKANILREIKELKSRVPSDGLLLFYFGGHGFSNGKESYLITVDAQWSRDNDLLASTSLSVTDLGKILKPVPATQKIIVLDSCRELKDTSLGLNDALPNHAPASFDELNSGITGMAIFQAADVGQKAFQDPTNDRGIFTSAFTEAISGAAAANTGIVTIGDVAAFVKAQVPKSLREKKGSSYTQTPRVDLYGDFQRGGFVLAVTPPPSIWKATRYARDYLRSDQVFEQERGEIAARTVTGSVASDEDTQKSKERERIHSAVTEDSKELNGLAPEERRTLFDFFFEGDRGEKYLAAEGIEAARALEVLALHLFDEGDQADITQLKNLLERWLSTSNVERIRMSNAIELLRRSSEWGELFQVGDWAIKHGQFEIVWSSMGCALQAEQREMTVRILDRLVAAKLLSSERLVADQPYWTLGHLVSSLRAFQLRIPEREIGALESAAKNAQDKLISIKSRTNPQNNLNVGLALTMMASGDPNMNEYAAKQMFSTCLELISLSVSPGRALRVLDTSSEEAVWSVPDLDFRSSVFGAKEMAPVRIAEVLITAGSTSQASKLKQLLQSVASPTRIRHRGGQDLLAPLNREEQAIIALVRAYRDPSAQQSLIELVKVMTPAYSGWACRQVEKIVGISYPGDDDNWFWQKESDAAEWLKRVQNRKNAALSAYAKVAKDQMDYNPDLGWFKPTTK